MNERSMQFKVGVAVLAMFLMAAILVVRFTGDNPWRRTNTFYIKFDKAPRVARETPIVKAGIHIGRVQNVKFADDDTKILVTAEIEHALPSLYQRAMQGDEFVPDGRCLAGNRARPPVLQAKRTNSSMATPCRALESAGARAAWKEKLIKLWMRLERRAQT